MKNNFKMLFLILGAMTLLFTCQKDEELIQHSNQRAPDNPPFKISKITTDEISENKPLIRTINL